MNPEINNKKDSEVDLGMNPDNANDANQSTINQSVANQNVINQNPNQNIANQNAVFPSQNLQSVQNPFAQNLPLGTPQPKSKKPILIACIVGVSVLILVVSIVCVVIMQGNNNLSDDAIGNIVNDSDKDTAEEVSSDVANVIDAEKFEQMTKAEVMTFLQAGHSTGGSMPENYVDKAITDLLIVKNNVVSSDVSLKYSHETIDDLRQIAEDWYGSLGHNDGITEDDYKIKEYDYYAIVTPNRIEGMDTCDKEYYGTCSSLLSFKRDYINYFREQTAPNSYNDVSYLNMQNIELVEYLLRTYSFFYYYGVASTHGNIYSSSFEEQDDKFVLTVYYVGVGLDMEKLKEGSDGMEYAINLYSRQYAADKLDGRLHVIQTGEDSTVNNIKSIPITQEEATQLLSR